MARVVAACSPSRAITVRAARARAARREGEIWVSQQEGVTQELGRLSTLLKQAEERQATAQSAIAMLPEAPKEQSDAARIAALEGRLSNEQGAYDRLARDITRREAQVERARAAVTKLSPREREVFLAVCAGKANKVTASELGLSEKTVEEHRKHVMTKLEVGSVADLVKLAVLAGLCDPADVA